VSVATTVKDAKWSIAEAHTIAVAAYGRHIEVEAYQVLKRLDLWRQWFYGMVPTSAILSLPGVQLVQWTDSL
jgi:hypothetical protein